MYIANIYNSGDCEMYNSSKTGHVCHVKKYLKVTYQCSGAGGEETGLITIIIMNIPIRLMCVTS